MSGKKAQFQARLENQKKQLENHGNFAEVVIRTTPEATDMINFARLWEYVLVQADRQTRGYIAKTSREEFQKTQDEFKDCVAIMADKLKEAVARHDLDLTGTNFISRVAQRYEISERKRKSSGGSSAKAGSKAEGDDAKAAEAPKKKAESSEAQDAPKDKEDKKAKSGPKASPKPEADAVDGF